MTDADIITPVTDTTDWVSSRVARRKKNGKIRVCIDPPDLNPTIKRAHYPLPAIKDVTTTLTDAKVFSVLDATTGFNQVKMDPDSSYLTTFNTPFGRYRWLRMPFGISCAPEEWQRRMHEITEGLPGVEVIADDFLVFGTGKTVPEATKDPDEKLRRFHSARDNAIC